MKPICKFLLLRATLLVPVLFLFVTITIGYAQNNPGSSRVQGYVFHDLSSTGVFDHTTDRPLEGVAVSNGRDVTLTRFDGYYELPLIDNAPVFVIKPPNYKLPVDKRNIPQFSHMLSSKGLSGTRYPGLPSTGAAPSEVNFPLYYQEESDSLNILVFGDTQPRNHKEIHYLEQDVLSELQNIDASFGVVLGDIVFDDLALFDHLTASMSTTGIPWVYVPGNHDMDFTADNTTEAFGLWYKTFGPTYYSFSYGKTHFIVLNNIRWIVEGENRYYRTGLGDDQLTFFRNEVNRTGEEKLLVVLTHIPLAASTAWESSDEQAEFFSILSSHPNSVSFAAHTHRHYHHFLDETVGFPGDTPHHMISMGTVCGSWWTGAPNEFGIPHATMADGTPNSYGWLEINNTDYRLRWKAAQRESSYQMNIFAPESVNLLSDDSVTITANIFNALPDAEVKLLLGRNGREITMSRVMERDPARVLMNLRERELGEEVPWLNLVGPSISTHLWKATISTTELSEGITQLKVEANDAWWEYEGYRLLRAVRGAR